MHRRGPDFCAAEGWGPPADNGDALRLLGEHGVLPVALAGSMRKAAGFRNILVHEYVEVSDEIVTDRLRDVSDLRRFIAHVIRLVTGDRT